jgi:imidazolonepropionase-like amidohydrolase
MRRLGLLLAALAALPVAGQDWTDRDVETDADRVPRTKTGGNALIRGATILTLGRAGTIENGSILIRDGKIAALGRDVPAPPGVVVVEAAGLTVMPGIIDCHSHIAGEGGLNEGSRSITSEVRIGDTVVWDDIGVYRAAAGGVTAINLLHGSANAIGGQNAVLKMRWGSKDLLMKEAPPGIKFALGENPKQSNAAQRRGQRYPNTRMGVEAVLRRAFTEAREYLAEWKAFEEARAAGDAPPPPRRDLRLEALVEVLEGKRLVHCHCYRYDEILMLLQVAKDFGFRVATLQHVLEGYKCAPEIAAAGTGASTFSDWWAFKLEAFDAIPYNAALMHEAGVNVTLNSDSGELMRRMPMEAAKAVKYGGVGEVDALKMITLNAAIQLGIDRWVGSIEVGKHADLAIFNGHPLSSYSRCVMTLVDGETVFEKRDAPDRSTRGFRVDRLARREPIAIAPDGGGVYAIRNATIVPVTSAPIEGGTVLIRNGKIEEVGRQVAIPRGANVVDAKGLFVYPGLIDSTTRIGLTEIGSVAGSVDANEIGGINPHLLAIRSLNPMSEIIPVTRANGLTTVLSAPGGGAISGQSALVRLDGWLPEEMAVLPAAALHVNFPRVRRPDDPGEPPKEDPEKPVKELQPYLRGERPVVFEADTPDEIRGAVRFAEEFKLKAVIGGGLEAWKVASLLREKDVPVLVGPVATMPALRNDPYDAGYFTAARLHAAGVRFAIRSADATNARNLPYHAALAAAHGLPRDEALRAITIYPARIFGVEDRIGSIEAGKSADLIVTTGDPIEVITDVVAVFIQGKPASLETKHTRLYRLARERILRMKR